MKQEHPTFQVVEAFVIVWISLRVVCGFQGFARPEVPGDFRVSEKLQQLVMEFPTLQNRRLVEEHILHRLPALDLLAGFTSRELQ